MDSYVHPVINAAVLGQVDLRAHLGELIQLNFPERLLATFLHESTHHWCFMSPVGNALALLRMRSYRRANALRIRAAGDHWDLLEDVLRQEATVELLRPFAEGLACFSELDSLPGKSNAISLPMLTVFGLFGGRDAETRKFKEAGIDLFLFQLLYRARTDPDLCRRRENVLAGPFSVAEGGHLAGYLSIKNLWRHALERSGAAWDAELFLCYLRSFFYDDYALISVLLAPEPREHRAVNAIAEYVVGRFKTFLTMDIDTNLRKFEESYTRPRTSTKPNANGVVHSMLDGLEIDPEMAEMGRERLEALLFAIVRSEEVDDVSRMMARFDSARMRKRELLCIGSLPGHVVVNEFGRVSASALEDGVPAEYPTFVGNTTTDVTAGAGAGALEFYLVPLDGTRIVAISRGHEVVFVHLEGPGAKRTTEELADLLGSRDVDLRIIDEQEANLEYVVAGDSISIVRKQARQTIPPAIDSLYSWLSTLHLAPDQWKFAAERLREGGLLELFGGDVDLVRGMAFLGVCSSVGRRWSELCEMAREHDIDLEAVSRAADKVERETGLRLLKRVGDEAIVWI